jgi:hypothetical protein
MAPKDEHFASMPPRRTRRASRTLVAAAVDSTTVALDDDTDSGLSSGSHQPAFFPFQLSDEMYARVIRDPAAFGYPTLSPGSVRSPKFGQIWVELRTPGARRPKLVDGFDWVPSSTANASSRLLRDGTTELLRYYCARRTKSSEARPTLKPFTIFQREKYDGVKAEHSTSSTYQLKSLVGERWRALSDKDKEPYVEQAKRYNRGARARMAGADPSQLLVRHEMWLQDQESSAATSSGAAHRVLVHYLGDGQPQSPAPTCAIQAFAILTSPAC